MVATTELNIRESKTQVHRRPDLTTQEPENNAHNNPFGLDRQEVFELGKWWLESIDGRANPERVAQGKDADTLDVYSTNFTQMWLSLIKGTMRRGKVVTLDDFLFSMGDPKMKMFEDWKAVTSNRMSQKEFENIYGRPLNENLERILSRHLAAKSGS